MAYTQAEVDKLKSHAARGILRGVVNGEDITFVSLPLMWKQIRIMEDEIANGGTSSGMSLSYPTTGRGL